MNIVHNEGKGFYIYGEEKEILAELEYKKMGDILIFDHTEVSDKLKGQGIAAKLLAEATKYARDSKLKVKAECSYVVKKFETGDYDNIKV